MVHTPDRLAEWLEADGLGGFASGTAAGPRSRRYHALLLVATTPPTGRMVLVNGMEAWVETPSGTFALSSQHYQPNVIHPDGEKRLEAFRTEPWPCWTFRLEDGTRLEQELFVPHGHAAVALRWRLVEGTQATLRLRPLMSGRDYHALHHENTGFYFKADTLGQRITWRPYPGVPGTTAFSNGIYENHPLWYRNFLYEEERARGLDDTEDLASPGSFLWDLAQSEAILLLSAEGSEVLGGESQGVQECYQRWHKAETQRRARFPSGLHRAADAYLVRRDRPNRSGDRSGKTPSQSGKTILAGYPWFTDWGRDTFIALRGLCLATGRRQEAQDILLDWAGTVSEGMLPNRFPDSGSEPEFNSVDASLWYIVAIHEFLQARAKHQESVAPEIHQALEGAIQAILTGYSRGTRYGIRADTDGLLSAGVAGVQLTWMDAKVGDWVVTPRIGKPVEVQALWLNALQVAGTFTSEWRPLFQRGLASFRSRFWNETAGYLHDLVDPDHHVGTADPTLRPNQILAIGGLPFSLLDREPARRVVDAVESRLWTPLGLRSLAPGLPGYAPRYMGGVLQRDGSYHQGTVWPWLMGPFVEAWVRVRGSTPLAKQEARQRFLRPLLEQMNAAGLGHVSEIADAEPPHTPRGCPFQAWSLGEVLRLMHDVLEDRDTIPAVTSETGEASNGVYTPRQLFPTGKT